MAKSTLQRLVDSGLQISEMSRQQAESVVRQLVKAGEVQRRDAEDLVQRLLEMGRETTIRVAEQVEAELLRQVRQVSARLDDVESRVESLTSQLRAGDASPSGTSGETSAAGDARSASTAKKSDSKSKSGASKGSEKGPGKSKKGSKEAAGGAAEPARRPAPAVGASGVRKVATTRAARDAD